MKAVNGYRLDPGGEVSLVRHSMIEGEDETPPP